MSKVRILMAAMLAALVAACGGSRRAESGRDVIAVSVAPQASIVKAIAGDRFDVVTVMEGSTDAESFEPSMQTRMAVDRAKAYLTFGLLPFERKLAAALPDSVHVVDVAKGIDLMYGTHEHGEGGHEHHHHDHDRGVADPHVWSSLDNAAVIAMQTASALAQIDKENASEYVARANAYINEVSAADSAVRAKLEYAPSRAFAIWHPSLSYFARDYGLEQIAIDCEGKEVSINRRNAIVDKARNARVGVVLVQSAADERQARVIADAIGARVVRIDVMDADIVNQINKIADALTR